MTKIIKNMAEAELTNMREMEKLVGEFRWKDRGEMMRRVVFAEGRVSQEGVVGLLERN